MTGAPEQVDRLVRQAARALGRHGLAHAYGHCSARLDNRHFLVCAPRPMGLIGAADLGTVVPVEGSLPAGVLGEVRIHQQIYQRRADVGGVVRCMPPKAMALGTLRRTPRVLHGFGSYFAPAAPLWDDPQLLRDDVSAAALARALGAARAIVMRGNGVVTAGDSLEQAVVLAWYLEDAARIDLDVLGAGATPVELGPKEAARRATFQGGIIERMWEFLTAGDIEQGSGAGGIDVGRSAALNTNISSRPEQ
jgi:HCOMODA/2-hydroxy-3-carboxy-muconic semialdehyde decarboxylase